MNRSLLIALGIFFLLLFAFLYPLSVGLGIGIVIMLLGLILPIVAWKACDSSLPVIALLGWGLVALLTAVLGAIFTWFCASKIAEGA